MEIACVRELPGGRRRGPGRQQPCGGRCRERPAEPRHPDGAPVRERHLRGGRLGKAEHRLTKLDLNVDLVNQRWNEGVTNAETITAELRILGFRGGAQAVRRYLQPFRLPGASRHPDPHHRKPAARHGTARMA